MASIKHWMKISCLNNQTNEYMKEQGNDEWMVALVR